MTLNELPGLPSLYAQGQNAANFAAKVADAAADFACDLYQDFPGAIIRSPIGAFNRGLMDSLCGPRNKLPPAPTPPPYSGGQCRCRSYEVTVTWLQGGSEPFQRVLTTTVLAPFTLYASGDNQIGVTVLYLRSAICENGSPTGWSDNPIGSLVDGSESYSIVSAIPTDGQPDDCGDPPAEWGNNLPDVIPDDRRSTDITINNNDGTNIVVPVAIIGSGNVFNLSPEFKVDVGGVTVTFDFSGAKIDFGSSNQNPNNPPPRNNSSADNFERIETAIKELKEKLTEQQKDIDDIKADRNDSPPPDDDPDIEKEEDEEESESGDKDVDKLQYVCVHLTKLPNREQWGDGAPNVYYAGWLEFKLKGCNLPRQPIHFKDSIFKAPDGATGFAYTLTNGAKGKVTVYKSKS